MKNKLISKPILILEIFCFIFFMKANGQKCGFSPTNAIIQKSKEFAIMESNGSIVQRPESVVTLGLRFYNCHLPNRQMPIANQDLDQAIGELNTFFSPVGVQFVRCGDILDVPDTDLAVINLSNGVFSNDERKIVTNFYVREIINVYLSDELFIDGEKLNGLAYGADPNDIPNSVNRIFFDRVAFFNGHTLPHEVGHFFGLLHTNGLGSCAVNSNENPDGSNCVNAGDFICDTPADPTLGCIDREVDVNCIYRGRNGYQIYRPLTNNIMSLFFPEERKRCRASFTSGQYSRMRSFLSMRQHLVCPVSNPTCGDTYELNNTRETANTYFGTFGATAVSTPVNGKISYNGDLDFFKVRFTQAGTFKVEMSSPPKNYNIFLYKGTIPVSESRNAGTQAEVFTATITTADLNTDYYILIQGAGSSDFDCTNPYNLLVTWQPQTSGGGGGTGSCIDQYEPSGYPVNRTAFTDTLGAVSYTKTITANLEDEDDYDAYNINLNHAGELEITLCGLDNTLSACLELGYGGGAIPTSCADGVACQRVIQNYSYNVRNNTKVGIIPKIVTNCGKSYTLTVKWTPRDPINGGGVPLCNNGTVRDYRYEPNETPTDAHFEQGFILNDSVGNFGLHQSGRIRGILSSSTDIDYHKIQVDKKGVIGFSLCEGEGLSPVLEILNSTGQVIHTVSQCYSTAPLFNIEIGVYYLKIRSLNGSYNCDNDYYFQFAYKPTETSGGGGSNNWTCSEAVILNMNAVDNSICISCAVPTFGTTRGLPNRRTSYPCEPASNMTGSEILYKISHTFSPCTKGLSLFLLDLETNPDNFAMYLFSDCNLSNCVTPSSTSSTTDFGNNRLFNNYDNLPTGDYYILIDSKNNTQSNFNIYARNFTCPVIINVTPEQSLASSFRYVDVFCSNNLQTYSIKFKTNGESVTTATSQYPLTPLGNNTFIVSNIPSGQRALITLHEGTTSVDLNLVAHTCNCVTIQPTNPQNAPFATAALHKLALPSQILRGMKCVGMTQP